MYSVENLTVAFGGFTLLDSIGFVIDRKERVALVGKNGVGKTTLLKIFAGLQEPTQGKVVIPKDTVIGYLPQQMQFFSVRTVKEEAMLAFEPILQMEAELEKLNHELSHRKDYESESYHNLIDTITHLNERLTMEGAMQIEAEVEKTLLGLGFERKDFDRCVTEFSGGWRMRIELAKILLQKPDILLLDEPTNHLDIESIQWVENFLSVQANAVILVSHDRAFIDNVTQRTIEISLGKIYDYRVNYSKYVVLRKERREQQMRAYENQRKQIEDTEAFIERFRYKASKAVQVQSRIKHLDKIERIEVDEEDLSAIRLKFPPTPRSGSHPVIIEDLSKSYGNHLVFEHATLMINRGDKVAFVGKNGEGKTTLVKCIMNQIPFKGKLQLGHNVRIGYLAQNQSDLMDEKLTVFETIDYVAVGDIRTKIRDILGAFMFGGEASDKKVAVLSGGERSRLSMIKMLLEPVNLLILDEPTNHLDMRSKDILKEALKEFDGTAIIVSHDREFLDGLVEKVYEFGGKRVKEHLGGIYEFLEKKKIETLRELERNIKPQQEKTDSQSAGFLKENQSRRVDGNLNYAERKEQQRQIKRLEKTISDLESQIEKLEIEIKQMEGILSTPAGASNVNLLWEHAELKKKAEDIMNRWTEATIELERCR